MCLPHLFLALLPHAQDSWTWVHGRHLSSRRQETYLDQAREMRTYYQERGLYPGPLVAEDELDQAPAGGAVFLGPLQVFEHPEWLPPAIEVLGRREVRLGGQTFDVGRTGIYLRQGNRIAFTGLSQQGYLDIFTVPTGQHACTVTLNGEVVYEGDFVDGALVLEGRPFLPLYPTRAQLADLEGVRFPVEPVLDGEALSPEFQRRLEELVRDKRVLFVGEHHWNRLVNEVFERAFAYLLETAPVGTLFLEQAYSSSAYLDHYVGLADDAEAGRFFAEELQPRLNYGSTASLLERVRLWNRAHPARRVHVACVDLEWGAQVLIERVLEPYFTALDPELEFPDMGGGQRSEWPALFSHLRELLAETDSSDAPPPPLTRDYLSQVVTNLEDTIALPRGGARGSPRQTAIVRNITQFHGALLGSGLAVFKGGGFHAVKTKVEGEDFHRDAAYLDLEFEPTRGRVATMMLHGLGYDFTDVVDFDQGAHLPGATVFAGFVRRFQGALLEERARAGDWYLLDGGSLARVDRLAILAGYRTGERVLRAETEEMAYDEVVFVLGGLLEPTRER